MKSSSRAPASKPSTSWKWPSGVIEMLERQPGLIGGATAEILAGCEGNGIGAALVARAVERIREGKMPQTQAEAQAEGNKAG